MPAVISLGLLVVVRTSPGIDGLLSTKTVEELLPGTVLARRIRQGNGVSDKRQVGIFGQTDVHEIPPLVGAVGALEMLTQTDEYHRLISTFVPSTKGNDVLTNFESHSMLAFFHFKELS